MSPQIQSLIDRGALFVVNHSGGKDSQAMMSYLHRVIPHDQLVIVHAILPEVDWDGIIPHIEANSFGVPVHTCTAVKTFFQMVEDRGFFPSPKYRQCTSDLKRGPIEKLIRHLVEDRANKIIVSCEGIRADESPSRRQATVFSFDEDNSAAGRLWYKWLPIHSWSIDQVWAEIEAAGQKRHWAYDAGMSRLSCCFCVMSKKADLAVAAKLKPELFARYAAMERKLDQTMFMPKKQRGQPAPVRVFLDEMGLAA